MEKNLRYFKLRGNWIKNSFIKGADVTDEVKILKIKCNEQLMMENISQ